MQPVKEDYKQITKSPTDDNATRQSSLNGRIVTLLRPQTLAVPGILGNVGTILDPSTPESLRPPGGYAMDIHLNLTPELFESQLDSFQISQVSIKPDEHSPFKFLDLPYSFEVEETGYTCSTPFSANFAYYAEQFARFMSLSINKDEFPKDPQPALAHITASYQANLRLPQQPLFIVCAAVLKNIFPEYQLHYDLIQAFEKFKARFSQDVASLNDMTYRYLFKDQVMELTPAYQALFFALLSSLFNPGDYKGDLALAHAYEKLSNVSDRKNDFLKKAFLHARRAHDLSPNTVPVLQILQKSAGEFGYLYTSFQALLKFTGYMPCNIRAFHKLYELAVALDHSSYAIRQVLAFIEMRDPEDLCKTMKLLLRIEDSLLNNNLAETEELLKKGQLTVKNEDVNLYLFQTLQLRLLLAQNKVKEAQHYLKQHVKGATGQIWKTTGAYEYHLGLIKEREGHLKEALDCYVIALSTTRSKKLPERNSWLLAKCRVLTKLFSLADCLKHDIKETLECLKVNGAASTIEYCEYSLVYFLLKSPPSEALQPAKTYLAMNPSNYHPVIVLIKKLFDSDLLQEAQSLAKLAYETRIKNIAPSLEGDFALTFVLMQAELIDEGLFFVEKYFKKEKNLDECVIHVALLHFKHQYEEVVVKAKEYLKRFESPLLHSAVAEACLSLKRYDEVILHAKQAVKKSTPNIKLHSYSKLIQAYTAKEKFQEAIEVYDVASRLKFDPDLIKEPFLKRKEISKHAQQEKTLCSHAFDSYLKLSKLKEAKSILLSHGSKFKPEEYEEMKKKLKELKDRLKEIQAALPAPQPLKECEIVPPLEPPKEKEEPLLPPKETEPSVIPLTLPQTKLEEVSEPKSKKEKAKPKVQKWQGTKTMQEEHQLPPLRVNYKPTLERCIELVRQSPCTIELYSEIEKVPVVPSKSPATPPPPSLLLVRGRDMRQDVILEELKRRKFEAEKLLATKTVAEAIPYLSGNHENRLMTAKNAIVNMGDFIKRHKDSLHEPLSRYVLRHSLLYNLIKMGEAFHSTSNLHPFDPHFKRMCDAWFIEPEIAHQLRNEARNKFHYASLERIVKCCQTIVDSDILQNLSNCLQFHDPMISAKEKASLKIAPRPHLDNLSICMTPFELSLRLAIDELNWLDLIYQKLGRTIEKEADYLHAAKMAICILDKCLGYGNFNAEEFEWLQLIGKRFAHVIGDDLRWGEIDEVSIGLMLQVMQKAPRIKQDILEKSTPKA